MEDPAYRKLMDYAMRALGQRAHTTHELRIKLKKRPHYTKQIEEQIINRLMELNLLNDEEFVKRAIEDAVNFRLQGRLKILQRLKQKGISRMQVNQIWDALNIAEKEVARQALEKAKKRFANTPKEKLYEKRARFLASRGFPPEIVFSVIKN